MTDEESPDRLYYGRASRFVEADPVRGVSSSSLEYSRYYLVVAKDETTAHSKLLSNLNRRVSKNWENPDLIELTSAKKFPLPERIKILREVGFMFIR